MGTQGTGRKRHPNRERLSAEDHALNQIAREAEARLAAKRAARAEAREIRMKELERQQKEIYQVQKKYYGLDAKWGDIEQWMEDSERYSHRPRRNLQVSDDDDLMSVTSRSSLRTNGYEDELLGPSQYRKSSRSSTGSGETFQSSRGAPKDEAMSAYYSDLNLASAPLSSKQQQSVHNGSRPSLLNCNSLPSRSQRGSLYDEGVSGSSRRSSSSRPPSEYSCYLGSGSRASSRASSARASPVSSEPPGPSVFRRGSNSASIPSLSHLDDVSVPAMSRVEERPDKDFGEKGSRPVSSLSAATLASLGGTSSRRGSGDTSISVDTEASIREIKEISELKEQIEDVEGRYMQGLKEMKDSLAEVEEKYKRSMVTNAQLDNEKTSLQYQVDTLREVLLEFEEELAESRRQYEDKHKECERQKHDQNILRFQLAEMKEALEQRESLLTKHGIALDSVGTPNGDASVEPHVNADGRPDPPIRATSMGPSEEAVEKKETMSVVGEIPPSKTEQANQEVLLTASSESPLNAEVGDEMKAQIIKEFAHNSNDDVNTVGTLSGCQTDLEHHGGLPLDSESTSNECEIAVDEHAPENVHKEDLEQSFSEMPKEATVDQRNTSPVECDVFQDALENVVQSPLVAGQFSEEHTLSAGDFWSDDTNISQQDLNKEEDQCDAQSTSIESNRVPNNGALEISDCRDNVVVITVDEGDLHKDTKDEHETSSSDDSSQDDSEGSTADEMTATAIEHEEVCEEEVKHEEQSVLVEPGLECREDESEKKDSNTNDISSEKESVSAETTVNTKTYDVADEKKNTDVSPEQSSQDLQLIKEEKLLVDRENNNYGEVSEPCILSNMQSVVKNEALRNTEEDSIGLLNQHEGTTDVGSIADLENPKNGKMNTAFPDLPGAELLDKKEENKFADTLVYDERERSNEKMNIVFSDAPDTVLLDEGKQDKISDHPVCDKSENINEKTNPVFPDAPGTELLEEEKQDKTSDHLGRSSSENTNDNISVVAEIQKDSVSSETLSSEGESTPEGEESDENEDVAVRSEKYTGESLPLGSSVDKGSTDDIRMEDSSDKAARKGKGKNKEDCVVS